MHAYMYQFPMAHSVDRESHHMNLLDYIGSAGQTKLDSVWPAFPAPGQSTGDSMFVLIGQRDHYRVP